MRNYYRVQRDEVMEAIKAHPDYYKVKIKEEDSGLHFLMQVDTKLSDEELTKRALERGVKLSFLSYYYYTSDTAPQHTLIINYSGLKKDKISQIVDMLFDVIMD